MAFKDYFVDFQDLPVNGFLRLRQVDVEKDLEDYLEIYADSEVFSYYSCGAACRDKLQVKKILENQVKEFQKARVYSWTIEDIANKKAIGRILLSDFQSNNRVANIGYFINKSYWGKGVASACISPVATFGFSYLKLERIFTRVAIENAGSWKALEKNGFIREGLLRHCFELKNSLSDCYMYARLCTD